MARYFDIKITTGTAPGPYTIYYDSIGVGNIATLTSNSQPATNLSYSTLTSGNGVNVTVPDSCIALFLYNESCGTSKTQLFLTQTPTLTQTSTPTLTPTSTNTQTPSTTATIGLTSTATETQTPTPTVTSTQTPEPTQTQTSTPASTPPSTPTLTQTPFPAFLLNSTPNLPNGEDSCTDYNTFNRATFYSSTNNGGTIGSGTFLYTSQAGVGNPSFYIPDGYYSNGSTYWFFQNGTTGDNGTVCSVPVPTPTQTPTSTQTSTPPSTPTLTQTPFPAFLLNSTPNLPNGEDSCTDYNTFNRATFYSSTNNGGTIGSGTFLYTSQAGVGNPSFYIPDGYYSNGSTYWFFQNGSTSDVGTSCPAPTPTATTTPASTPTSTPPPPSPTPTPTSVYYYYLVYDVNINCNAFNGVVYRTTTDYSSSILTGKYAYVNGDFGTLKYIETTYVQAFVNTLNSIVITDCVIPTPTPTPTPPSYFYNAYVLTCNGGTLSCDVTGTEAVIYSGPTELSNGSYYSNGTTVWQPYGSTNNPGLGNYVDVQSIIYTQNGTCYDACLAY